MLRKGNLTLILLTLMFVFTITGSAAAQTSGERHFPETGHTVRGEFLAFFYSAPDPLLLFGYPITDEFPDLTTGIRTQYFQKARFDLVYVNGVPKVQLAPLGEILHDDAGQAVDLPESGAVCRAFANDTAVCYAFLQFYDTYEGGRFLGLPLAPVELRDGRLVQYFENGRLEWRPELPTGERVKLTDLGRIYFDTRIGDPARLAPALPGNLISKPVDVRAAAFVSQALLKSNDRQTLYAIVQDQYFDPVPGAEIIAVVRYPDGSEETFSMPPSDANGISVFSFNVGDLPERQVVQIQAQVSYQGQRTTAFTWFRSWW